MVTNHLEDLVTTAKFYEAKGKEQRAKSKGQREDSKLNTEMAYLHALIGTKKNTGLIRDSTDQVNNES